MDLAGSGTAAWEENACGFGGDAGGNVLCIEVGDMVLTDAPLLRFLPAMLWS